MKSPSTIAILTTFANVSGVLARFDSANIIGLDPGQDLHGERQLELEGGGTPNGLCFVYQ
jgi:hypothetical protein